LSSIKSKLHHNVKKYYKESSIIIIGQILIFLASIGGVKILTTVMTPASYGELMLFNTVFIFSTMLLYNPLQQATGRYFNNYYYQGIGKLKMLETAVIRITKKNYLYNLIAVSAFAIFFVVYKGFSSLYGCLFLLIYCISFSQFTLYITVFNTLKFRIISSWLPLLERILKPVCGALLIYYIADKANFALAGQAIGGVIVLLLSIHFYRKYINANHLKEKLNEETEDVDKNFVYFMRSIPIRTIFLWIFLSSDRWVLEVFRSSKEVGLYSALSQIGYSPVAQIASVVSIIIGPYIYNSESVKSGFTIVHKRIINYGTSLFIVFTFFMFFGAWLLKDLIYKYLIDESFNEVAYLLPYVVLSGGIFVTSQYYGLKALIRLKPELLVLPSAISAVVGTLLYALLGYLKGINGIVYANLISNIILLSLTFIFCNKNDLKTRIQLN